MIKIEHIQTAGWEPAIRGMRNPMNSWEKSDSVFDTAQYFSDGRVILDIISNSIGPNDLALMQKLAKAGPDHRKFMRMIVIYMDITAPLYWWKEFETYKVGTVSNSCSTMHKIAAKEFTLKDFSCEHLGVTVPAELNDGYDVYQNLWEVTMKNAVAALNSARGYFVREKDPDLKKQYWWQMIQLLPSSYNQKRTVMLSYEVLRNIYAARKDHKLDEWRDFCQVIKDLPYSELITGETDDND